MIQLFCGNNLRIFTGDNHAKHIISGFAKVENHSICLLGLNNRTQMKENKRKNKVIYHFEHWFALESDLKVLCD
jgi:hypothetical protein